MFVTYTRRRMCCRYLVHSVTGLLKIRILLPITNPCIIKANELTIKVDQREPVHFILLLNEAEAAPN